MDLPAHLLDGLGQTDVEVVRAWWLKLPETNQFELAALCDRRRESCFFGPPDDWSAAGIPRVFGGRFVSNEDTRGWKEWRAELFDFLVCHPEFAEPQVIRIFHIGCVRHLPWGEIREDMMAQLALNCPFGSETCPIQSFMRRRTSC